MSKFVKPGTVYTDYPEMCAVAMRNAFQDAQGLDYSKVQCALTSFVFSESCAGNRACYEVGMTGIPIINVNNNCSSGATALFMAKRLIESGTYDCVAAMGFEKMQPGSIKWGTNPTTESPMARFYERIAALPSSPPPRQGEPKNPYMFACVGLEHMKKYGSTPEDFARVGVKNHLHSADNPNAQFRDIYTLEQVMQSPMISPPLTKLQCSPTSDGAAAVILCSPQFAKEHLADGGARALELSACELTTDTPESFQGTAADAMGKTMSRRTAQLAYAKAGVTPREVDVVELHDCFSVNELITYEALGLCAEGEGHHLIREGRTGRDGGGWYVNPSGSLIAKGHSLGATGLSQVHELVTHLRGEAGPRAQRSKPRPNVALAHNIGIGGACVVSIIKTTTG